MRCTGDSGRTLNSLPEVIYSSHKRDPKKKIQDMKLISPTGYSSILWTYEFFFPGRAFEPKSTLASASPPLPNLSRKIRTRNFVILTNQQINFKWKTKKVTDMLLLSSYKSSQDGLRSWQITNMNSSVFICLLSDCWT